MPDPVFRMFVEYKDGVKKLRDNQGLGHNNLGGYSKVLGLSMESVAVSDPPYIANAPPGTSLSHTYRKVVEDTITKNGLENSGFTTSHLVF